MIFAPGQVGFTINVFTLFFLAGLIIGIIEMAYWVKGNPYKGKKTM